MTELFLLFLGAMWVVLLGASAARGRRRAPHSTAARFRRGLQTIAPSRGGRWVVAPPSSGVADRSARRAFARAQRRRKTLLIVLALCVPASMSVALLIGGWWWAAAPASCAVLGVYVWLLVRARKQRSENAQKVRLLARRRDAPPELFVERRA